MSYLWRLTRLIIGDGKDKIPYQWPADTLLKLTLSPPDLFGVVDPNHPRTTGAMSAEMRIEGATGRMLIADSPSLPPFVLDLNTPEGQVVFRGNEAELRVTVPSEEDLLRHLNWLLDKVTLFATAYSGIFVDVVGIQGTIAGRSVAGIFPPESYSAHLAVVDGPGRDQIIRSALQTPGFDNPSYARIAASCHYFRQALRLVSPGQVSFPPYTTHSETLLNLSKALEVLLGTSKRDKIRERFRALGFDHQEIESQIIPIFLVRNELDVAHPALAPATREEIVTMRRFVDRTITNVAYILRTVLSTLEANPNALGPIAGQAPAERKALLRRLQSYREAPALDPDSRTPAILGLK